MSGREFICLIFQIRFDSGMKNGEIRRKSTEAFEFFEEDTFVVPPMMSTLCSKMALGHELLEA